jgi:riboflavin kinase/FMN adenylyltransferase
MSDFPETPSHPIRSQDVPDGSVVCVGVFDGVHRGHRSVLALGRAKADQLGLPLVVVTFDPHPMQVLRPAASPQMLSTLNYRVRLLQDAGADLVHVLRFSSETAALSPQQFVQNELVDVLGAKAVLVGANFRFGHKAAGDVAELTRLGDRHGFETIALDLIDDGSGQIWSSTEIRQLVATGDVAAAADGLTRLHRVEGPIVEGDRRGRELGYPTANLEVGVWQAVPAEGVYAGWLIGDPYADDSDLVTRRPAAVSVGVNRTFNGVDTRVEAHVIDVEGGLDLYGEYMALDFAVRLRAMERFDSINDLTFQMGRDVDRTRNLLTREP